MFLRIVDFHVLDSCLSNDAVELFQLVIPVCTFDLHHVFQLDTLVLKGLFVSGGIRGSQKIS